MEDFAGAEATVDVEYLGQHGTARYFVADASGEWFHRVAPSLDLLSEVLAWLDFSEAGVNLSPARTLPPDERAAAWRALLMRLPAGFGLAIYHAICADIRHPTHKPVIDERPALSA